MLYPIQKGFKHYVTQEYGLTAFAKSKTGLSAYKNFPGGIHPGWDFGTNGVNAPAIALKAGKVIKASKDGGWGNHVEIACADGWNRQYAHLSAINVVVGQQVKPGDVIGKVGTSGASTGIHLHYGKRRWVLLPYPRYEYVDPADDFKDSAMEPEELPPSLAGVKLLRGSAPEIFVISLDKKKKYHLPDMETLTYLFGSEKVHVFDQAFVEKIPSGDDIPSLK